MKLAKTLLILNHLSMSPELAILMFVITLVGGFCITTIGPGGIFVTIALFALFPFDPSTVAGTASATFIASGIVGSWGYLRSGQLGTPDAKKGALVLSITSVIGAFAGSQINTLLDASLFAILLGLFIFCTGLLILYRQRIKLAPEKNLRLDTAKGMLGLGGVGIAVGLPGGMLGVGGPVLAVPILVVLGVPMLLAVGLAQVQSIFISGMATAGYMLHDAVDWALALFLVIPLLIGTVTGWVAAQKIRVTRLQVFLAIVLVTLGVYLMAGGATLGTG